MADSPITTGASSLGASGLDNLLTFFADQFLGLKRNRMPILSYINTNASEKVEEMGQTVNVPIHPEVSSRLLTDGDAIVKDDDVGSKVAVTLNKHRYSAFSMTQIAQAMETGGVLPAQIQNRMASILNDVEADIMSVITSGLTTNVVNAYNTAPDEDDVLECCELLDDELCPPERVGLMKQGAKGYNALAKLSGFNAANVRGDGRSGEALSGPAYARGVDWHGTLWHKTQAMPRSGTSTDNFVGHRDAICAAFRPLPAPMSPGVRAVNMVQDGIAMQLLFQWDGSTLSDEFVLHLLYGYAIGKEEWGVLLKT